MNKVNTQFQSESPQLHLLKGAIEGLMQSFATNFMNPRYVISREVSKIDMWLTLDRIADCLPSRNTLKKWVVDYSTKVKKNIIASLKAAMNFFVTMDIWSQPGLDKFYLGVVAVFYNPKSPRIQAAALACRDFPRPQTGLPEYPRPERTDDAYVEIELDIEKAYKESDDDEELLSDNESDDGNGPAEENGDPQAEKEDDVYDSEQENFPRVFPKRMACIAHALNIIFHKILDCALLLKSAIISVCQEHVWGIDFDWADVKKIVRFLKLLAMTTTYLEGNLYPTTASVIPSILSLKEHFQITKEKDRDASMRRLCEVGITEMKKRFGSFMDVKHDKFHQINLICSLLHPSKTLELTGELFQEGKRRLLDFIRREIAEGNCLIKVPEAKPIEVTPYLTTETHPQSKWDFSRLKFFNP
ncbi:Uncharacterized protein APZ42_025025 [Daphnia magna]|uniref:Uncharacterized protein n=1 Tax=Daphnia magna TaxID=35525 RepID=A0A164TJ50_9CRUS|nr:Uncharacterized protein APZ42_025025 [Daphnia magna]